MKYKLIAMDLDGTLTQHKSPLDEKNTALLRELNRKYRTVMVGAGSCTRIYEQMNRFPIDIIGNYGMQLSRAAGGEFRLIRDDRYAVDREFFEKTATAIRKQTGYTEYTGDNVEYHPSGAVTFPLLGTAAKLADKLAFDPDGKKRGAIYRSVANAFKDYNCFIGGTSSFDIVKKQYDKYRAIMDYIKDADILKEEILYIGDDFKQGGNDEQIKLNGIDYLTVADYRTTGELLEKMEII